MRFFWNGWCTVAFAAAVPLGPIRPHESSRSSQSAKTLQLRQQMTNTCSRYDYRVVWSWFESWVAVIPNILWFSEICPPLLCCWHDQWVSGVLRWSHRKYITRSRLDMQWNMEEAGIAAGKYMKTWETEMHSSMVYFVWILNFLWNSTSITDDWRLPCIDIYIYSLLPLGLTSQLCFWYSRIQISTTNLMQSLCRSAYTRDRWGKQLLNSMWRRGDRNIPRLSSEINEQ